MKHGVAVGIIIYEIILIGVLIAVGFWYGQQPQYCLIENIPLFQRLAPVIMGFLLLFMVFPCFWVLVD